MKMNYQKPGLRPLNLFIEGMLCLSGGRPGGDGKPGADFSAEDGDIFDGGLF